MKCIYSHLIKRLLDVLFSLLILVTFIPLFIIISIIIKITSPSGSVFFGHERVGVHGKKFICWKFRTMIPEANVQLKKLLTNNTDLVEEFQKIQKLKNDPRIIPKIGHFLRRTSIDELPQFLNVFLGSMSVVGPRPITIKELEYYGIHHKTLLSVRPGITGLWQVSGRNNTSYQRRVELDLQYIGEKSFWLDLTISIKTVFTIIRGDGY